MAIEEGEGAPGRAAPSRFDDPITDHWSIRMSWSLLFAGVLHGSLFGFWPLSQATRAEVEPPFAMNELVWITPYEPGGDTGLGIDAITVSGPVLLPAAEGEGMTTAVEAREPILVEGPGTANQGEGAGAEASFEDLLRRTAGGPSLAGSGLAGLEFQSLTGEGLALNEMAGLGESRTPQTGDPSATDSDLEGLSALDLALERLAGFTPEVALEATSSWVLLRNPRDVERFMGQHSIRQEADAGAEGAVAVALWIDTRGSVEWAEIIQSSGREDMDRLALQLFNDVTRFRPARLAGVLMPMSAIFSVSFFWF